MSDATLGVPKKPTSRSHSSKNLHSKPERVFLPLSYSHGDSSSGSFYGGTSVGWIGLEEFREGPCVV